MVTMEGNPPPSRPEVDVADRALADQLQRRTRSGTPLGVGLSKVPPLPGPKGSNVV